MQQSLSKIEFGLCKRLLNLYPNQPWLAKQDQAVLDLAGLCKHVGHQSLLFELLERIQYFTQADYAEQTGDMLNSILQSWNPKRSETQFVATTVDDRPDSAQAVLYLVEKNLGDLGWTNPKTVNLMGKSVRNLVRYPNVIIIDDFAGTGTTIAKRIREFRKCYDMEAAKQGSNFKYTINVCILIAMEEAKQLIESLDIRIHVQRLFRKGISGHNEGPTLKQARKYMLELESVLNHNYGTKPFPRFGWGEAEALVGFEERRTPNSVFPIFWWPELQEGKKRHTVLQRHDDWMLK